jgi:hypothetical protein
MTTTLRRRWTEETIVAELAPVAAELGRMPTRAELTARGLGGAWSAMQRRGGPDAFRRRLEPPRFTREDVELRAYFIAQERGGDPIANWLAAEAELTAA